MELTDWEHYTDDDGNAYTLDWSSADAVADTQVDPRLLALIEAIVERKAALGLPPWAGTTETPPA